MVVFTNVQSVDRIIYAIFTRGLRYPLLTPKGATYPSPGHRSCEKINNFAQRRRGAEIRNKPLLCFLFGLCAFAPLAICFCSFRDFFTDSSAWVERPIHFN
jgi:hypothetical protein